MSELGKPFRKKIRPKIEITVKIKEIDTFEQKSTSEKWNNSPSLHPNYPHQPQLPQH